MLPTGASSDLFDREAPHDCREALFGGRGKVRVWSPLAAPRLPFTAVLACELEPGARVGAHVQEHYPELVIGISGNGRALVNGVFAELGPGRVVELPLGDTLVLDNPSSDTALRYLIVKSAPSA